MLCPDCLDGVRVVGSEWFGGVFVAFFDEDRTDGGEEALKSTEDG